MDSWNTYSGENTPKYYEEKSQEHSENHDQLGLHSSHNTPVIRLETPLLQLNTPQAPGSTPGDDTFSDQMFLHQLEQNLYHPINPNQQQLHHHTPETSIEIAARNRNTTSPPSEKKINGSRPGSAAPELYRPSPANSTPGYISYQEEPRHSQQNTPSNHNTPGNTSSHSTIPSHSTTLPAHSTALPSHSLPSHPNHSHQYEFGIESLSFIDGLNFDEGSLAFPPLQEPDLTPSLLAMKESDSVFESPMLPGQNDKLYNNQHYFHKHKPSTNANGSTGPGTVRPDAVFTPLVSPAVTPLDSQVNMNRSYTQPVQIKFEPLTSPALQAQPDGSNDRRRSSSSVFGPRDEAAAFPPNTYHKRRTPHGTPILAATKQSPSLKLRGGAANKQFEKLPDSSMEMLPPKKNGSANSSTSTTATNTTSGTPLMGFTMVRLAEQQSEEELRSTRSSRRLSFKNSLLDTLPVLDPQNRKEKPAGKKALHKLAEQGRRNRMNMAVHELASLVPQHYHDEVAIPSKATTVELASRYIRDLLEQREREK